MTRFYDTCALLNLQEDAFVEKFYCSDVSLYELENIKTSNKSEDVKYKARRMSRLLDEYKNYTVVMWREGIHVTTDDRNDCKIIDCAVSVARIDDVVFVSDDICCKNLAKIYQLKVESSRKEQTIYTGYKEVTGNTEEINRFFETANFATNQYAIINNIDDGSTKEMRFDGEKFVQLKLPPSRFIKAKNALQRCALDMLANPEITVCAILGGYGSGKTHLAMKMSLWNVLEKGNQSKILGVREVVGEGAQIGYLPGEKESKIGDFFTPMVQQLDGGEFELENLRMRGILEQNIPYFMKGTTYNDTVMIVDEAEDLNEKQIKLVGTRLGNNSRIFLAGDYKQSVINPSDNNALVKMCNAFKGNKKFGCIYLGEDVRSETSKMFAEL